MPETLECHKAVTALFAQTAEEVVISRENPFSTKESPDSPRVSQQQDSVGQAGVYATPIGSVGGGWKRGSQSFERIPFGSRGIEDGRSDVVELGCFFTQKLGLEAVKLQIEEVGLQGRSPWRRRKLKFSDFSMLVTLCHDAPVQIVSPGTPS